MDGNRADQASIHSNRLHKALRSAIQTNRSLYNKMCWGVKRSGFFLLISHFVGGTTVLYFRKRRKKCLINS